MESHAFSDRPERLRNPSTATERRILTVETAAKLFPLAPEVRCETVRQGKNARSSHHQQKKGHADPKPLGSRLCFFDHHLQSRVAFHHQLVLNFSGDHPHRLGELVALPWDRGYVAPLLR